MHKIALVTSLGGSPHTLTLGVKPEPFRASPVFTSLALSPPAFQSLMASSVELCRAPALVSISSDLPWPPSGTLCPTCAAPRNGLLLLQLFFHLPATVWLLGVYQEV